MVEVVGNIVEKYIYILIKPGSTHSYITPRVVEICAFKKVKHRKSWLVQLTIGTKRKVSLSGREMSIGHEWIGHLCRSECSTAWFL